MTHDKCWFITSASIGNIKIFRGIAFFNGTRIRSAPFREEPSATEWCRLATFDGPLHPCFTTDDLAHIAQIQAKKKGTQLTREYIVSYIKLLVCLREDKQSPAMAIYAEVLDMMDAGMERGEFV